ncbi:MAG: COG1470 family protein [Candidatus Bathyarchaeales archaeon]
MNKMHWLSIATLILIATSFLLIMFFAAPTGGATLNVQCEPTTNIVNKRQGEAFTVNVKFKNIGNATGTWNVNISFESESNWSWRGTSQTLTLKPYKTATLSWTGNVPTNAEVGSTARLIVYFDDEIAPQDWWIYVLANAELKVIESEVH